MSKKNGKSGKKRKSEKKGAKATAKPKPAGGKSKAVKVKAEPKAGSDDLDQMAERLHEGASAARVLIATLLVDARKEGVRLSAKARKSIAAMAKSYRKSAKDLKKLSSRKGR